MFDVTKETIRRTSIKMKKVAHITEIMVQLFYMGYLVFALFMQRGIAITNGILLVICCAYFLFYVITVKYKYTKKEKLQRKRVKRLVKWAKIIIKIVVIGFAIGEMIMFEENRTISSSVLLAIMIVSLLITIILDLLVTAITNEMELIYGAFMKDMEKGIKIYNFFSKKDIEVDVSDKVTSKICKIQEAIKEHKKTKK